MTSDRHQIPAAPDAPAPAGPAAFARPGRWHAARRASWRVVARASWRPAALLVVTLSLHAFALRAVVTMPPVAGSGTGVATMSPSPALDRVSVARLIAEPPVLSRPPAAERPAALPAASPAAPSVAPPASPTAADSVVMTAWQPVALDPSEFAGAPDAFDIAAADVPDTGGAHEPQVGTAAGDDAPGEAGGPEDMGSVAVAAPAASPLASAAAEPVNIRHIFKVYYGTIARRVPVARLEYSVRHDGEQYEIRTLAKADGLASFVYSGVLTQQSVGRIGPDGLEPSRYVEQRGNRPQRSVSFDHDQRLLTTADRRSTVLLPAGTQDRLSVIYQLGLQARATPERFGVGTTHEVPVASMSRVTSQSFSVVGEETLMSADGPLRALHLSRTAPDGSEDPSIDVWLGYDLGMLPVRVRIADPGGRVLDQVIEREG
jgi:hypothetical protein